MATKMHSKIYRSNSVDNLWDLSRITTCPPELKKPTFTVAIEDFSQELKNVVYKHPISKLNNIMAPMKKLVQYETISMSGALHALIFTVRAKIDDLSAYGSGTSKKIAKRNAAVHLLKKIMDDHDKNNFITSTTSVTGKWSLFEILSEQFQNKFEIESESNPICSLQEFCIANHWELPRYHFSSKFDEYNIQKFTVVCSVKVFSCTGEGTGKKSAKKQAADMLFKIVQNLSFEELAAINEPQKLGAFLSNENQFTNNSFKSDDKLITSELVKYTDRLKNQLKSSTNPAINLLKRLEITNKLKNAVSILYNIGQEEGFTSTYTKSKAEKPTVLLKVSIPLLVHMGTGKSFDEAQDEAARGALVYLQLLLDE